MYIQFSVVVRPIKCGVFLNLWVEEDTGNRIVVLWFSLIINKSEKES